MKVLVTGGAGFIGSHLCEKLINDGEKVTSLDNYSTGRMSNHIDGVNYINGDTKDIENLVSCTPDIIYHLGEYSRVEQSFDDIEKVWRYNMGGIFAVLQFCRKTKAKLIYAGSSTKFADDGVGRSQSPYAWTKASNTELVENYGEWFGIKYAITYFYNVYGGREIHEGKYATLIGILKRQYLNNHNLTIVSPGSQTRNFTHISDIIKGICLVGEYGYGDGYGIGSDEEFSVLEIAELFSKEIKFLPKRPGNRFTANLMTAKTKELGWSAKISIEDHISSFISNN